SCGPCARRTATRGTRPSRTCRRALGVGARSANEVTAGAEWLFADVGGTNVRVCRWRAGAGLGTTRRAPADAYTGLGEALAGLDDDRAAPPDRAAIAIALQVRGARLRMTNRDWVFDAKA